ncbi:MAG: polysaccharide deacetylase family protein [Armatimonadota bacterium]
MNYSERITESGLTIFLFHGVVKKSDYKVRNYTKKHLLENDFYNVLKDLKKSGNAVSIDDIVNASFPERAFAVSFDDGFENNYSVAAPILKDLGIPSVFYLTTGFIENNHMSWIDRIEYLFENVNSGKVKLSWESESYSFSDTKDKIKLLDYLRDCVKKDKSVDVDELVNDISSQLNIEAVEKSNDPLDLKMNWYQAKELASDSNFIIGGHSHRHLNLAFLSKDELEKEIKTSIELIKDRTGISLLHYSYPEGLDYCYSDEVIDVLKKYGIKCSPTAIDGVNKVGDDLFHLKRVAVV